MSQSGFTLIESLVVLVIIALIGEALTFEVSNRLPGLRLDQAARATEEQLRSLQTEAMMQDQEADFSLADLAPRGKGTIGRRLARIASVNVQIQGAEPTHRDQLRFLPGGWSPGGKVVLHDGGRRIVIQVDWPLGIVREAQRQ
jgi:type II secretion system protein H